MAYGAIRHHRLYDFLSSSFLKAGKQPGALLRALRIGCHQLFALDQIPVHAACDTTVELLRQHGQARLCGVANAVMRKLLTIRLESRVTSGPTGRILPAHIPKELGILHSLPNRLIDDLRPVCDASLPERLAALDTVPPLCTRTRRGCAPPVGKSIIRRDGEWTWWEDPQEALSGVVADRRVVVQDHAQGHVVRLAAPRPGQRVLDCCAAPGGKALSFVEHGCFVVAADLKPSRMKRLQENLQGEAALLLQDVTRSALSPDFDIVLADVPCSNTGVMARRPEARLRYDNRHLESLHTMQRNILASAATLVRSDGKLIYSTCSIVPHENQGIAHNLKDWRLLAEQTTWPDAWQGGGYVAVLVRK